MAVKHILSDITYDSFLDPYKYYISLYKFHTIDHRGEEHAIAIWTTDPFTASIELINKGYTILSFIE